MEGDGECIVSRECIVSHLLGHHKGSGLYSE